MVAPCSGDAGSLARTAEDLERTRAVRRLEQEIIQSLAGVSYALEAEDARAGLSRRGRLVDARNALHSALRSLGDVSRGLRTPGMDPDLLAESLVALAAEHSTAGLDVRLDLREAPALGPAQALMFHRIAREALSNAARHSGADAADLLFGVAGHRVMLHVRDAGRGFDPQAPPPAGALGLRIMRAAAGACGGVVNIESGPGHGTSVAAAVPAAPR